MNNEIKKIYHTNLRILGVEMPVKKNVHIALTSIYGIGNTLALKICKALNIDTSLRLRELDENIIAKISKYIEEDLADEGFLTEGNLKTKEREYIRNLADINCYRWTRIRKGLPINSRTKTNAKTSRLLYRRNSQWMKTKNK